MKRTITAVVLATLMLLAGGCGSQDSGAASTGASAPSTPSSTPTAADTAGQQENSPSPTPAAGSVDDLGTGRARHVIRSGGVTATLNYETGKPATPWTATSDKPLRLEVKVSRPQKKVYLNRVTLRFAVDDGSGVNPGPDPLVDTSSNIVPGYLVAPPYSYVQSFSVPDVDPSIVGMTIYVRLEFVSLVEGTSKDYTKQTITDTLRTRIN